MCTRDQESSAYTTHLLGNHSGGPSVRFSAAVKPGPQIEDSKNRFRGVSPQTITSSLTCISPSIHEYIELSVDAKY